MMKKIFKIGMFIFLAFFQALSRAESSFPTSPEVTHGSQNIVDFHLHLFSEIQLDLDSYRVEIERILKIQNLKKAVLITPTYLQSRHELSLVGNNVLNTPSHIRNSNLRISELISSHAGRVYGLCGESIHRDDAIQVASDCLKLPGMIGIKIRNFALDPHLNGDHFGAPDTIERRFESLLRLANEKGAIILSHFSGGEGLFGNVVESERLFNIVKKYPYAKLVIAHSGIQSFVGLNGLAYFGDQYARHSIKEVPRNVYIEISKTFSMAGVGVKWDPVQKKYIHTANWNEALDFIHAWRKFGIDHVLYGSDFGCSSHRDDCIHNLDELDISDCPFLSIDEKNGIYQENAEKLLSSVLVKQTVER